MNIRHALCAILTLLSCTAMYAQRTETLLEKGWKFSKGDFPEASAACFDDSGWDEVTIPHDWKRLPSRRGVPAACLISVQDGTGMSFPYLKGRTQSSFSTVP